MSKAMEQFGNASFHVRKISNGYIVTTNQLTTLKSTESHCDSIPAIGEFVTSQLVKHFLESDETP